MRLDEVVGAVKVLGVSVELQQARRAAFSPPARCRISFSSRSISLPASTSIPASASSSARATTGSRVGLAGATTAIFLGGSDHRHLLAGLPETRARQQAVEGERRAAGQRAVPLERLGFSAGWSLFCAELVAKARTPVGDAIAPLAVGDAGRRDARVALEPGGRLGGVAEQEVSEGQAPGGVVGEGARPEVVERRLQRREALLEAAAVVLEPARQVLRLGGEARVRKLRDHLAITGDRLVVAIGARERPGAVEGRRRRLVARQMRHRRQQQVARLGVVAPHVELGHPDLVVALGRLLRRQTSPAARSSSTSASSQCRSFVSDSARFRRSGTERLSVAVGPGGAASLVEGTAFEARPPACPRGEAPRRPADAPGSRARSPEAASYAVAGSCAATASAIRNRASATSPVVGVAFFTRPA